MFEIFFCLITIKSMSKKKSTTEIDIKKEIALSILNIGEILTKTIDYYSLTDRKDDLNEFIEICKQQAQREKKNNESKYDAGYNKFELDDIRLHDDENLNNSEKSLINSIERQKSQKSIASKSSDKKSNYSLNHLIQDVDKKIKILNGIFSSNDYNNLSDESIEEIEKNEANCSISQMKTFQNNDSFTYLYESMDLFEEMKQLNEIMNDLNLIIDKNEHKGMSYGTFV
ncbi:hypothetical protein BpHYR1_038334 [Brachionus plicatilis]|uniref:Uncharacterized protein n=1 Tax=Brachionus plicatilis TaxID=10195 RepID=A0A3M7REC9_BRAPC|nr:hypothetical protein BpHYR1_038334 [Brachionus plicatilis]